MANCHKCTQCGRKHPSGMCWTPVDGEIYIISCLATGKHYVGQASRKKTQYRDAKALGRWQEHWMLAGSGKAGELYEDMRTHGRAAFKLRIVDSATNRADLYEKEARWVAALCSANPGRVYNTNTHLHADF